MLITTQTLSRLAIATISSLSFAIVPIDTAHLLAAEQVAESTRYPLVRSSVLQPNLQVPWSQPVRVVDPFEGEYLAVFDQHYFSRLFRNRNSQIKVISLWNRDSVRLLLAYNGRECRFRDSLSLHGDFFYPFSRRYHRSQRRYYQSRFFDDGFSDSVCVAANGTQKIAEFSVKVGDRVFQVKGSNNQFPVSAALATALKNAAEETTKVRLVADNGEVIDSEIGKATVRAWKSVY